MIKMNLKIVGDLELKRKIEALGARARGSLLDAARAGGEVIRSAANPDAPGPHVEMGNEKVEGGRAEVSVGPDKEHWHYQFSETGAEGHEIASGRTARHNLRVATPGAKPSKSALQQVSNKTRLAFQGRDGLMIRRRVKHPGIPARPFLRPAIDAKQNRDAARDAAGKVFRKGIDELTNP